MEMSDSTRLRCPNCGTINRVPLARIDAGEQPICGRCKTPLQVDDRPIDVTDATFAAEVERSPTPVLVDLWAPWCPPCRAQGPVIDQLAAEMKGRVRFAKVNVDDNPQTAQALGASSIPTLVVYKDGQLVDRMVGMQSKGELKSRLARVV